MPRLYYISDLHLEFHKDLSKFEQYVGTDKLDILCLAGDIGYPELPSYKSFLEYCSSIFSYVFIIAGNHEYYNTTYPLEKTIESVHSQIQEITKMFPNVFFLQNDFIYVQEFDIYVLGSTMWTDPGDDMDDLYSYNDFRRIKSMTQPYMEKLHKQSVGYLESKLQELKDIESKVVVLTHHLPTYQLIHDKYKGGSISHLFAVELSHWFSKYHIDYWICGHTHSAMDKTIANTRLLVNPVGYPGENRTIHKCYVEIE